MNSSRHHELQLAVTAALNGGWKQAHLLVQDSDNVIGYWIHAVLHKMEPDEANSRYWYARARKNYDDFADARLELQAVAEYLQKNIN